MGCLLTFFDTENTYTENTYTTQHYTTLTL